MRNLRNALLLAAASLAFAGPARAADLEPAPYEPVPVEIGSGWYLRGDVSYDFGSDVDVDYKRRYQTHGTWLDPVYGYKDEDYGDLEIDEAANVGVGLGYQFTDYFRGDLTAHYWKADLDGSHGGFDGFDCYDKIYGSYSCRSESRGEVEAIELMANAYVDLGTFAGFTPYVGGGVGAVRIDYDDIDVASRCYTGGSVCPNQSDEFANELKGENSWRFAYALSAGMSYDMTQTLKLDVGYRYVDVDGGDAFGGDGDDFASDGKDDGFERHTIQAGLRYSLF